MPNQFKLSIPENVYLTKCGASKTINDDRDSTLKLWYKLHRKKCAVCKNIPYKFSKQHYTHTTTVEGYSDYTKQLQDPMYKSTEVERLLKLDNSHHLGKTEE